MSNIQLPSEIMTQIIQSTLISEPTLVTALKSTCSLFKSLLESNNCLAAHYCGMYGDSVYLNVIRNHPTHFTPQILGFISQLRNRKIPNGVYQFYQTQKSTNKYTLEFLEKKCENIDESVEFMELYNEYVGATKIEGGIANRDHLVEALLAFIHAKQFIPAYTSDSRIHFILESLPVCLFEESKELATFICEHSGLNREEINSKMVAKIMWDYGYLKEWSSTQVKKAKVNTIMELGGFEFKGRAIVDIIRRNTWVNWVDDLEERVSKEEIEEAVKIVIEEQLKRQSGGGYMVAQRLASSYSIPSEFVDKTYSKYAIIV